MSGPSNSPQLLKPRAPEPCVQLNAHEDQETDVLDIVPLGVSLIESVKRYPKDPPDPRSNWWLFDGAPRMRTPESGGTAGSRKMLLYDSARGP